MNARLTNRPRAAAIAAALIALCTAPAAAQEGVDENHDNYGSTASRPSGWIVTVGAGAQAYPKYPGADDLGIFPMPIVGFRRAREPVPLEAPDEGFGFGLLGQDAPINIGPAVNFQRRRREEDVGAAVGEVGWTAELGGFVEAFLGENFRIRGEVRQAVNGHDGLVADLGADLFARGSGDTVFSIGPRLRWADNDYMDAYYGVSPAVAGTTGVAAFDPGSGIHAVGATAGMRLDVGGGFAIHGYARYDRLMNDAADSPIVTGFGSRNQWGGGLGLSYSFRVGGR
ncbi:MAG: MipA family protein [Sphingomonadales bacterium]|nr:MipA family protein [Sphingomonadales bacterium]